MDENMRNKLRSWRYLGLAEVGTHIPSQEVEETPSCMVEQGVGHRLDLPRRDLCLEAAGMQRKEADKHQAVAEWDTRRR